MEVIKDIASVKCLCRKRKLKGEIIGFVPTMGALHKGHLSLIERARKDCDFVVVSIFVNPAQFNSSEDLKMYPRDLSRDIELCEKMAVDVVFVPSEDEMYPEDFSTWVQVEGRLTRTLEGTHRPGHFKGVATVVAKLFNIILPTCSYFGEKDYQQALLIKKMVKELNMDTRIILMPTVREEDGLACSSRNRYLSSEERKAAAILYRSLLLAKKAVQEGEEDPSHIKESMRGLIRKEPLVRKIDYIAIVNPENLEPVEKVKDRVLVALAAWIGKARLIDNMLIKRRGVC